VSSVIPLKIVLWRESHLPQRRLLWSICEGVFKLRICNLSLNLGRPPPLFTVSLLCLYHRCLGQAHLFNMWIKAAMDRTWAQPHVKMSFCWTVLKIPTPWSNLFKKYVAVSSSWCGVERGSVYGSYCLNIEQVGLTWAQPDLFSLCYVTQKRMSLDRAANQGQAKNEGRLKESAENLKIRFRLTGSQTVSWYIFITLHDHETCVIFFTESIELWISVQSFGRSKNIKFKSDLTSYGGFIKGIQRGVRCTKSLRVLFLHRRPPSWTTLVLYSRAVFIFNEPAYNLLELLVCVLWMN